MFNYKNCGPVTKIIEKFKQRLKLKPTIMVSKVHTKALWVVRLCKSLKQLDVADRYVAQAYRARKINCQEKADLLSELATKYWQLKRVVR